MSTPFIGRDTELRALARVLPAARDSRAPGTALIVGQPGTGKSRLLAEFLARVAPAGTVRVVGFEPSQPIPLAAVGDLLRRLSKAPRHGAVLEELLFGRHDLQANDPLRIFEASHRALSTLDHPILAIDDLQWVDDQSLALVDYLLQAARADGRPLVVVGAARPSPAAAAFRATLEADMPRERSLVIELGPLTLEDGRSLAQAIDHGLGEAAAIDLWRRSQGSPFWLEVLARAGGTDDPARLIRDRLRALSSDAGELLAALAVGARPFPAGDLARVLGRHGDQVDHAARELITRGLATWELGSLRLAHDLIREAAARALPAAERRRLDGAFADVIESGAGDDLQLLSEAIEHRLAAGRPAASVAARLLASPQRRLLTTEGLRLLASISDRLIGTPQQVTLDRDLGELAGILGEQDFAIERWTRVSRHSHDPQERQHAEIESARAAYRLGRALEARAHLDHARDMAPVAPTTAVELDALLAEVELWLDHQTAAGSRTAERALDNAEAMAGAAGGIDRLPIAGRRAFLAAIEVATDGALQEGRADDVLRLAEVGVRVARELDDESHLTALVRTGFALRPLGRIRESEARYRQAWEISRRLVSPGAMVDAGYGLARSLHDLGRLREAREVASETVQLESRLRYTHRRWGNAPSILHAIELSLGDPAGALGNLRSDAAREADPHYQISIHQAIAAWLARFGGAQSAPEIETELVAARASAAVAGCPRCSAELSIVSAELLARAGRVTEAKQELSAWEQQATTPYLMSEFWHARARAAIALAAHDDQRALAVLGPYGEALEGAGLLVDLLWARLDQGRGLAGVDRHRAVEAFTQAAELANRIGAASQGRLAGQALRSLGVRAWRRGRAARGDRLDALSEREREVAHLVADGQSNREIAETLLVSPKTVERHLTNVLAKLGLRNRTELAALVHAGTVRGSPDE